MQKFIFLLICNTLLILNNTTVAQTRQADSLALVNFYNNNCGADCTLNWNLNQSMDNWTGVTLANGRVVELYLPQKNLTGPLPNWQLTALESLNLYYNQLTGGVLNFTNLPHLEYLSLSSNNLTGNIPNFTNLPNLIRLDLRANNLTGNIPNFNQLSNLESLNLSNNDLTGSVPNFTNLPNLRYLILNGNDLTGNIPTSFGNLSNLLHLSLSGNNLTGNIPNINSLPNLQHLSLSSNNLTGNIPNFNSLPNLRYLYLSSNNLSGSIPNFNQLPDLIYVRLANNQLSGTIPSLNNQTDLRNLDLSNNNLSGNMPSFSNNTELRILELYNNQLSGNMPSFSNNIYLEYLELYNNNLSGNIPSFNNNPDLVYITLQNNQLNGSIPSFTNCPNLRSLSVNDNRLSGIVPSFVNSPMLNFLALEDNQFTFEDLLPSYTVITTQINDPNRFRYAAQDVIGQTTHEELVVGSNYTIDLGIDDAVSNNTYKWYKDGVLISTTSNNQYTITNFQPTDAGVYTAHVSNTTITNPPYSYQNLILHSRPITLAVCSNTNVDFDFNIYSPIDVHTYFMKGDISMVSNYNCDNDAHQVQVGNCKGKAYIGVELYVPVGTNSLQLDIKGTMLWHGTMQLVVDGQLQYSLILNCNTSILLNNLAAYTQDGSISLRFEDPYDGCSGDFVIDHLTVSYSNCPAATQLITNSNNFGGDVATKSSASASNLPTTAPSTTLLLYPNPTTNHLYLSLKNSTVPTTASVKIIDMLGVVQHQQLIKFNNDSSPIVLNVTHLPAGNYVLLVQDAHNLHLQQVFVVE